MRGLRALRYALVAGQALGLAVSLYQSGVVLAGYLKGRPATRPLPAELPRFGLIICARNEQDVVGGLLSDFEQQDYPHDRMHVVLVAHNCTDDTAKAGERVGAHVVELNTPRPGKLQAILAGMRALPPDCDLAAVFDADSRVSPDLLQTVARVAPGEECIQVETTPQGRHWLSASYGVGRKSRNLFWWRPREALGMGVTINGSGFFIRPALAKELLPELRTVTEDLELTAHLYASGRRIAFTSATKVRLEEPHQFAPSVRQRTRWARGHFGVLRHGWLAMAQRAVTRRDFRALDIALYILLPSRVLTRTSVTGSFLLTLIRVPFALPLWPVLVGMTGEWAVPLVIAFRERLFPLNVAGLKLATRHGILGVMWFPIGAWALVTSNRRSWSPMPRARPEERDALIV